MKRIVFQAVVFMITVFFLLGCSSQSQMTETDSASDPLPPTPTTPPVCFEMNSYTELYSWFMTDSEDILAAHDPEEFRETTFLEFVTEIRNGDKQLAIPYYKGTPMSLRRDTGFPGITVMSWDLYVRPAIWYFGEPNGQNVRIEVIWLTDTEIQTGKSASASELIRTISPNAPNTDNYSSFSSYKRIYETELSLKDRTVSALVSVVKDDTRVFVAFAYNDVLVFVQAPEETLTTAFWADFSVEHMEP